MKEFGGYLPMEGRITEDYFSQYGEEHILRTNSGKAAIYYALKMMKLRKVYVPYYFCESVRKMVCNIGIEVEQFYLDDKLLPKLDCIESDAGIIVVNYFGMMEEATAQLAQRFHNIIFDNTHALFAKPIFRDDVMNAYSCRKFIGVPDGGYLVGNKIEPMDLEPCKISQHFMYLVDSFENGTNSSYQAKKDSDAFFNDNYKGMSLITRRMLSTVDYSYIKECRKKNFEYLQSRLGQYNLLTIEENGETMYLYPLWTKKNIKSELIAHKIYVPAIWRELVCERFEGTLEYRLSNEVAFLPLDQRYSTEDMEEMCDIIIELLGEKE